MNIIIIVVVVITIIITVYVCYLMYKNDITSSK